MARYKDAIEWIANNDDTEWLDDPNGSMSVTACLVSDLFSISEDRVKEDIRTAIAKIHKRNVYL